MPAKDRTLRIAAEIKKILSGNLNKVRDPRISDMSSVTRVDLTRDLRYAKVYVSVYDEKQENQEETIAALNHAKGFLRHFLAQETKIRTVPELTFILDDSAQYSQKINKILSETLHDRD